MRRPMTPYGYARMRKELFRLKSQRPALAQAIETARAHGDLSENADYDAAKERSGMIEAKIRDFEGKLATADIVEPSRETPPAKVVFGTTAVLEDVDSGEERRITIVGADETDTSIGYISFESPIGRALIGKESGDIAQVRAPGGLKEYEVMEIEHVDWSAKAAELESE